MKQFVVQIDVPENIHEDPDTRTEYLCEEWEGWALCTGATSVDTRSVVIEHVRVIPEHVLSYPAIHVYRVTGSVTTGDESA